MANDKICVFCGEKLGLFQFSDIRCADTLQQCCKTCLGEMAKVNEAERCRRALRLNYAISPEKLQAYVDMSEKAEARRPACTNCGTKLRFKDQQYLENGPGAGIWFAVIPAYCETCGKCEFYLPEVVEKNEEMAFLVRSDTN